MFFIFYFELEIVWGKKKSRSEITGAFLTFSGMRGILCDLGNGLNQSAGVEPRVGALGGEQGLAWSFRKAEQQREKLPSASLFIKCLQQLGLARLKPTG